jgi:O-succinylbenzoic acid--CoA ligase
MEKVEVILAQALLTQELDCRSFVYAEPDAKLGSKVVAALETSKLNSNQEKDLLEEMAQYLSKYEVPKKISYFKNFRVTSSGKIDKIQTLSISPPSGKG